MYPEFFIGVHPCFTSTVDRYSFNTVTDVIRNIDSVSNEAI